jgi:hypothetical protein
MNSSYCDRVDKTVALGTLALGFKHRKSIKKILDIPKSNYPKCGIQYVCKNDGK